MRCSENYAANWKRRRTEPRRKHLGIPDLSTIRESVEHGIECHRSPPPDNESPPLPPLVVERVGKRRYSGDNDTPEFVHRLMKRMVKYYKVTCILPKKRKILKTIATASSGNMNTADSDSDSSTDIQDLLANLTPHDESRSLTVQDDYSDPNHEAEVDNQLTVARETYSKDNTDQMAEEDNTDHMAEEDNTDHMAEEDNTDHMVEEDNTDHMAEEDNTDQMAEEDNTDHMAEEDNTDHMAEEDNTDHMAEEDSHSSTDSEAAENSAEEQEARYNPDEVAETILKSNEIPAQVELQSTSQSSDTFPEIDDNLPSDASTLQLDVPEIRDDDSSMQTTSSDWAKLETVVVTAHVHDEQIRTNERKEINEISAQIESQSTSQSSDTFTEINDKLPSDASTLQLDVPEIRDNDSLMQTTSSDWPKFETVVDTAHIHDEQIGTNERKEMSTHADDDSSGSYIFPYRDDKRRTTSENVETPILSVYSKSSSSFDLDHPTFRNVTVRRHHFHDSPASSANETIREDAGNLSLIDSDDASQHIEEDTIKDCCDDQRVAVSEDEYSIRDQQTEFTSEIPSLPAATSQAKDSTSFAEPAETLVTGFTSKRQSLPATLPGFTFKRPCVPATVTGSTSKIPSLPATTPAKDSASFARHDKTLVTPNFDTTQHSGDKTSEGESEDRYDEDETHPNEEETGMEKSDSFKERSESCTPEKYRRLVTILEVESQVETSKSSTQEVEIMRKALSPAVMTSPHQEMDRSLEITDAVIEESFNMRHSLMPNSPLQEMDRIEIDDTVEDPQGSATFEFIVGTKRSSIPNEEEYASKRKKYSTAHTSTQTVYTSDAGTQTPRVNERESRNIFNFNYTINTGTI